MCSSPLQIKQSPSAPLRFEKWRASGAYGIKVARKVVRTLILSFHPLQLAR